MKPMWCKLTTLALALLMIVACLAFVGCNNDTPVDPGDDDPVNPGNDPSTPEDPGNENPAGPGEEEDPPVDLGEDYLLTLPATKYGKTYTFLTSEDEWRRMDLWIANEDEAAGDTLDEAKWNRNLRVAEYLDVEFDNISRQLDWITWSQGEYPNYIRNVYGAGDQDFQLASCYFYGFTSLALEGLCADLRSIDTIDLSAPWYWQSCVEDSTINGQTYGIIGDVGTTMWDNIFVLFFNKDVASRYELVDTLYDMAGNREFTLEFMMECAEMHSVENGNDVWDMEDTYGIAYNRHTLRTSLIVYDIPLTQYNENTGEYEIVLYNEFTEEVFGTMRSYLYDNNFCFVTGQDGDFTVATPMFMEDRLLFLPARLSVSQELRNMEGEFGILPMPMYDLNQDDYHGEIADDANSFIILSNAEDPEFCGAVIHALGAESKYSVIPTYYDVILKGRTTKDEESGEMLDIIREALTTDFGRVHGIGNLYALFGERLADGPHVISFKPEYDRYASGYTTKLEDIMNMYWDIQ